MPDFVGHVLLTLGCGEFMAKRNMCCIKNSFGRVQISNSLLDLISVEARSYIALLWLVRCIGEGVWLRCFRQHPFSKPS